MLILYSIYSLHTLRLHWKLGWTFVVLILTLETTLGTLLPKFIKAKLFLLFWFSCFDQLILSLQLFNHIFHVLFIIQTFISRRCFKVLPNLWLDCCLLSTFTMLYLNCYLLSNLTIWKRGLESLFFNSVLHKNRTVLCRQALTLTMIDDWVEGCEQCV